MNVRDYVRFYNRSWTEIGQIVDEVEDSHLKVVKCRDGFYDLDNFIKSSPNIIDLIEVGDYVNGEEVIRLFNPMFLSIGELPYVITDKSKYEPQDIKSIVTKEQFENCMYKVGD